MKIRYVLAIALFIGLFGVAGNMDYEDECHSVGGVILPSGDCSK